MAKARDAEKPRTPTKKASARGVGGARLKDGLPASSIRIECRGADLLPLDAIEEFQGNLKKRTSADIEKIITSITKYGFSFPFFVWNGDGHNRCLDGHGRIQALAEMRRRGESLPLFPVSYIEAKDEAEAKQKLLRLNSQYGTMSVDSVLEFMDGLEIEGGELALPGGTLDFESIAVPEDLPPKMDTDFAYQEQFGVIVICKDEAEQEATYEALIAEGYTLKVVKT